MFFVKVKMNPLQKRIGFKSEFGFDTVATEGRSVAKRMFELLNPILF
ncbi:MAG: hypothetical protein OXB86_05905 [Bdellovibrionales bacterium]|nr:hypothetical protein [Bdellovibrionales bacterium]